MESRRASVERYSSHKKTMSKGGQYNEYVDSSPNLTAESPRSVVVNTNRPPQNTFEKNLDLYIQEFSGSGQPNCSV